jgi:hypothetical protein
MNPFVVATLVGGGIFFLAKKNQGLPSGTPASEIEKDPKATLSGPDGTQSTATGGAALSAFPAVGDGRASGSVQTAAPVIQTFPKRSAASAKVAGTSRPLTDVFQSPRERNRSNCQNCQETQKSLQAAIGGLAPDLRF